MIRVLLPAAWRALRPRQTDPRPQGPHGHPHLHRRLHDHSDRELDGIFFASGRGSRKGVSLGSLSNLDVAPTVARLLSLEFKNVDGKPLEAALDQP